MSFTGFNDANYGAGKFVYTGSTAYQTKSPQYHSLSSGILGPWTQVKLYWGTSYNNAVCTLTNASEDEMRLPDFKQVFYDPPWQTTNINDTVSSMKVDALPNPCQTAKQDYLTRNPDVAIAGLNPWFHYRASGQAEKRYWGPNRCDGGPDACEAVKPQYLALYPDVAAAGLDAWNHYAAYGRGEGRAWPSNPSCDGSAITTDPAPYAFKIAHQGAAAAMNAAAKMVIRSSLTAFAATVILPAVALPYYWVINYNTSQGLVQTPHVLQSSGPLAQTLTVRGAPSGGSCKADLYVTFTNRSDYDYLGTIQTPSTLSLTGLDLKVSSVASSEVSLSYNPIPLTTTIPNSVVLYADGTAYAPLDATGSMVVGGKRADTPVKLELFESVNIGAVQASSVDVAATVRVVK